MTKFDIENVLDLANDLKIELNDLSDVDEFNQAIIGLCYAVQELHIIDDFIELENDL